MKRYIIKGVFLLLCCTALLSAQEDKLPTVRVKDITIRVLPAERVRALGLTDYPDVPKEKNAAYDFINAINTLKTPSDEHLPELKEKWQTFFDLNKKEKPDIRDFEPLILANQETYKHARKALGKDISAYPVDAEAERMIAGVLLPQLTGIRNLARLFVIKALFDFHYNEIDTAIEDLELGYRTASSTGNYFLISSLVHIAADRLMFPATHKIINSGKLNKTQLEKLSSILDRASAQMPSPQKAIESEKLFATVTMKQVFSGKVNPRAFGAFGISIPSSDPDFRKTEAALNRILLPDRIVIKDIEKTYEKMIEIFSLPWPEYTKRHHEIDWNGKTPPVMGKDWNILIRMFIPALGNMKKAMVKGETVIELLRAGCLAERHRVETGTLPVSPEDIPGLKEKNILDPFTLKHFEFITTDSGLSITSAGNKDKEKHQPELVFSISAKKGE